MRDTFPSPSASVKFVLRSPHLRVAQAVRGSLSLTVNHKNGVQRLLEAFYGVFRCLP